MGMLAGYTKGALLGIEGIDAAGKRTQSFLLEGRLRSMGTSVATISFPDYRTPIGGEIKAFLHGERDYPAQVRHMLFAANRWERSADLRDLLSKFDLVVVNRYSESNYAFGMANGLALDWLMGLEAGLPKTDLVLLLDAPASSLFKRRQSNKDSWESDQRLQDEAGKAYRELAAKLGWKVVNAGDSIEKTNEEITRAATSLLAAKAGQSR